MLAVRRCAVHGQRRAQGRKSGGSGVPEGLRLELYSGCTKLGDLFRMRHEAARGAGAQYRKACAADEKDACNRAGAGERLQQPRSLLDFADLCSDHLSGYDVLSEASLARAPCEIACAGGIGEACDNSRTCTGRLRGAYDLVSGD